MDFGFDDEQVALREAVRGLLTRSYADFEHRRRTVATHPGFDEVLWGRLAEMGVLGLPFAEEDGGMGAGAAEVAIVAQELGRVLAPEPFLASVVLAGGVVAAVGSAPQRAEVLGSLASGDGLPVLAHAEPGSRWATAATEVTAAVTTTRDGESWTLTGVKEPVPHGARADLLVVSAALPPGSASGSLPRGAGTAHTDGGSSGTGSSGTGSSGTGSSGTGSSGTGVFLVDVEAAGLQRTGYSTYDGGRAARITFESTPAVPLGIPGADATEALGSVLDAARIIACSEAVGAMEFALSATSDYLRNRHQFGVPLSSFQALTFRASDMYVSLELAKSVALWATMALQEGSPQLVREAASRAGLQVSRAGRHVGQEAIQLHGGIAMTAEYSVGSYTSHLTALDHLLGDGQFHLTALARAVGDHADVDPLG